MGRPSKRKKRVRPDEYFRGEGIELARFGRFTHFRNTRTPDQHRAFLKRAAEQHNETVLKVERAIERIAAIVARRDPLKILRRAWWENAVKTVGQPSESTFGFNELVALRMLDYLQSVIVSTPAAPADGGEPTEDEWATLLESVEELFTLTTFDFHLGRYARKVANGQEVDQLWEDLYFEAQIYWSNVRGKRYGAHNEEYFRTLLEPHEDILTDVLGTGTDGIVQLVEVIHHRTTLGLHDALTEIRRIQGATMDSVVRSWSANVRNEDDLRRAIQTTTESLGLKEDLHRAMEQICGYGLFRLTPNDDGLPIRGLDLLSFAPGEDVEFFADGNLKGWPLRVWPIWRRPFLRVGDSYFCFNYYSVIDNLYRVLQRLIFRERPAYRESWNQKQKQVTEAWPFHILREVLPGSRTHQSVYYKAPKTGQWCELDGLLLWDDVVFVVEVKAGAFYREPPTTDFDTHIRSMKELIEKPSTQAARFLDYFESQEEVALYDESHTEIARLRAGDYGLIVPLAVILDSTFDFESQASRLAGVGITTGGRAVWTVSVDNLFVYRDVMTNPLVFMHFIENRLAAARNPMVTLYDELDNLGMYLSNNAYVMRIEEVSEGRGTSLWHGYRTAIDHYYYDRLADDGPVVPPRQSMPGLLQSILDVMEAQQTPGRRAAASALLWYDESTRNDLCLRIRECLELQRACGRVRPLTLGGAVDLTIVSWQVGSVEPDRAVARRHAAGVMCCAGKNEGRLLELTFSADGALIDVAWLHLKREQLSPVELADAERAGQQLLYTRVEALSQRRHTRKIGRNALCPCGSGQKYKRCHAREGH